MTLHAGVVRNALRPATLMDGAPLPQQLRLVFISQIPRSWTWVLSLLFLIVIFLSSQKTKLHFSRTLRRGIWVRIAKRSCASLLRTLQCFTRST